MEKFSSHGAVILDAAKKEGDSELCLSVSIPSGRRKS